MYVDDAWMDVQEALLDVQPVSFVQLRDESTEGIVSFREPVSDEKLETIKGMKIELGGKPIVWKKLDGKFAVPFFLSLPKVLL
jgi:hypothetical protein